MLSAAQTDEFGAVVAEDSVAPHGAATSGNSIFR